MYLWHCVLDNITLQGLYGGGSGENAAATVSLVRCRDHNRDSKENTAAAVSLVRYGLHLTGLTTVIAFSLLSPWIDGAPTHGGVLGLRMTNKNNLPCFFTK